MRSSLSLAPRSPFPDTDVEESNSLGELPLMSALTGHYLEPLARDIHNMTGMGKGNGAPVWASPYYVGNLTRHPQASEMTPRFYGDFWGQVFEMAPDLDFIAPQDSMGAQGNSFANVTTFLTELRGASTRAGRKMMSNVELFEVWPQSCQWSPTTGICKGRRPGEAKDPSTPLTCAAVRARPKFTVPVLRWMLLKHIES